MASGGAASFDNSPRSPRASARSARCARWAFGAAVLAAFLVEALLLSLAGGLVGLGAASFMQAVDISTTNIQTFAELAFRFKLTPEITLQTLGFALGMGFVGGFIPAWRAGRLKIVDCLREA